MTEQKEFESLDELFRKTFDNLPETPAKSGWDIPSDRVWQHVQKQIKPPQSGWSAQTLTLIAAFAVTLAVGLYLLLQRPAAPETPAAPPPPVAAETTAQEATRMQQETVGLPSAPSETPATVMSKTPKRKAPATEKVQVTHNETRAEAAKIAQPDSFAGKPAEQERKVPNTTLRRKAELAKRAEQAWKTPLEPLPPRWPGKPKD